MQQTVNFQLSLFGKTSWELFHQMTGWIFWPCSDPSSTPKFQCLILAHGQTPEWCEGEAPIWPGGLWTPNTGQRPAWHDGSVSSSWRILEGGVLPKYCLRPAQCSRLLYFAERAGCPPPAEIEALLLKQGGVYPSSDPFRCTGCAEPQRTGINTNSETALDFQTTLFPLF